MILFGALISITIEVFAESLFGNGALKLVSVKILARSAFFECVGRVSVSSTVSS